ncbi:phosphoenolpyruvate synthase, partial [Patescibacteria group bacterium]|nr:phosphoenolpyruvate synthase [Patescibacteria group bacterium]
MKQKSQKYILWFKEISKKDVPLVGGKNASLGEMFSQLTGKGINVPDGFATTSFAYWYFLKKNGLLPKLKTIFKKLNVKDIKSLQKTGKQARNLILKSEFPEDLKKEIIKAYQELVEEYGQNCEVAIRSSGVAEDAPQDSFAGMFETYLNVRGEENLLEAIKKCLTSSFNDRAIAYREEKKVSHLKFALSVGIQKMVRSDLASSGIIFTLDTETGFKNVVLINSIYGVGEMIVKGKITPDEFYVFKPTLKQGYKSIIIKNLGRKTKKYIYKISGGLEEVVVSQKEQMRFSLTEEEILTLAKWAITIEEHYGRPQDIEWARDGKTGKLFITQSRPETVFAPQKVQFYQEYEIKVDKKPILTGIAIGNKIGQGKVHIIEDVSKISQFQKGEVLVTKMTDPDWVTIFPLASAIVTNEGGKTCHSAIVGRELGLPCIVGTKRATQILKTG